MLRTVRINVSADDDNDDDDGGGGEREEAAVEKGRLSAKGPKKAASFRKHSFD